jgi:hypothetical protein
MRSTPWGEIRPVSPKAYRRVNCVACIPAFRNSWSYNCVTARDARRMLAHAQGSTVIAASEVTLHVYTSKGTCQDLHGLG